MSRNAITVISAVDAPELSTQDIARALNAFAGLDLPLGVRFEVYAKGTEEADPSRFTVRAIAGTFDTSGDVVKLADRTISVDIDLQEVSK